MDPRMKKTSNQIGSDIPSPVLLRRRLSAPETVMRKYKLERARSQESDSEPSSYQKFEQLSCNSHGGSEINLQKKKDNAVMMRKSTLLRRLMNNPKTFGSSSFQEWQHYCGKLSTPSLNSLQGSPEHTMSKSYSRRSLIGYEYKTSPKHNLGSKKVSPVHQLYETHKRSPIPLVSSSPKRRMDNCNHQVQTARSQEHTNSSSQRSSRTDELSVTKTTFTGQSDSAYSNDRSNFTPITLSSGSSSNTHLTTKNTIILKNNPDENMDQRNVDENRNFPLENSFVTQETSTQTNSTTNLNVISNVKLSQKTLDLIVSEVMKDVQQSCVNGNNIQGTTGSIHVRKISGTNVKLCETIEQPNDFLKSLNNARHLAGNGSSRISEISTKSSVEERFDFIEDHSDVASLADSLEETSSSRLSLKKHDEKPVRGDLPPIPIRDRLKSHVKPPDAFFVPMKKDIEDAKSVSDYMPEKLKEKILLRQKNRQDKSSSENKDTTKSHVTKKRQRFRKPQLPSIESIRKKQQSEKEKKQNEDSKQKKTKSRLKNNSSTNRKSKSTRNNHNEQFHVFKTENDYSYEDGPKRFYHKAEFKNNNRRIEILEIMECVNLGEKSNRITTRTKSKIPVLKNHKATSPILMKKATYLDFSEVFRADSSLDQLIADILMQSLNHRDGIKTLKSEKEINKPDEQTQVLLNNKTLIPEEITTNDSGVQVSEHEFKSVTNKVPKEKGPKLTKDSKNTQTVADERVDFQKKEERLDHTSNEGGKPLSPKIKMKNRKPDVADFSADDFRKWRKMQTEYDMDSHDSNGKNDYFERVILPPMPRRYAQSSRRSRYKHPANGNPTPGEWSIMLSGMNNATSASDLEMKIRFPSSQKTNSFLYNNDDNLRAEQTNNEAFIEANRYQNANNRRFSNFDHEHSFFNENNERYRKLPGINLRDQDNRRTSDPVATLRAMEITDIRPRQTKTSLKRYSMTRQKLHPLFETNSDCSNIDSQYSGMLNRVPDLLSINGYSVSPDYKYNIPGIRRNIPRHNCLPNAVKHAF